MRATRTEDTMTTTLRSLIGAIIVFAFAACGGGDTDNPDDGNTPPDQTCNHDCGGSSTPPNPDETVGAVENLTANRVDPIVNLTWDAAENALGYRLTRINGAEVDLGMVNVTSFMDTLPADHIGVPVRYRVTPVGQGNTPGQSSEVMTQPNVEVPPVEDPPVEDPPMSEWIMPPNGTDAIRAVVGLGATGNSVIDWNGDCNGEIHQLHITVLDEVDMTDADSPVYFHATDANAYTWFSMGIVERDGQYVAFGLVSSNPDSHMEFSFFNRFSANTDDPWFHGGFNKRTELNAPPCRFTPAPEDPGN